MKIKITFLIAIICYSINAQVGIGTTSPDNSAVLDLFASDKGILIPRVSLSNINITMLDGVNVASTSLLIWNTNPSTVGGSGVGFYFFNGSNWTKLDGFIGNTLDQAYDNGGAGLGRTIIADTNPVRINGNDGFLVTGTFGTGSTLDVTGAGTRAFFYPKKAAFRTGFVDGTQWDDANIGDYSFATGRNTRATGMYSMAVNENNLASGQSSSAFGVSSTASGQNSFSAGNSTQASGFNSFATGKSSIASGDNTFTTGNNSQALSFTEVAGGSFNSLYTPASINSFNIADRAFVIGNGTGFGNRKDAFEVWKDGRVIINDAYTLPTTDGAANQVLTTNGAGTVTWSNDSSSIVSNSLYAADASYLLTSIAAIDLPGFETSIIPTLYNSVGNIQIKVIVRYTAKAVGSLEEFRLRAHDGTTQSFPITFPPTFTWTTTATQSGGVVTSDWKNWNAGTLPLELHLQGRTSAGGSMTIQNVYILIKSQ
jgi:hypothetical protein